jgi:hypothetical protein
MLSRIKDYIVDNVDQLAEVLTLYTEQAKVVQGRRPNGSTG